MKKHHIGKSFYGSTTVGEKGQVVIPMEARKAMKLLKGEKLLVFGKGTDMLALAKISQIHRLAEDLSERLERHPKDYQEERKVI